MCKSLLKKSISNLLSFLVVAEDSTGHMWARRILYITFWYVPFRCMLNYKDHLRMMLQHGLCFDSFCCVGFTFLSLLTWYLSFCSGMWSDMGFYFCHLSCILRSQYVFHHPVNIWKQVGFIKQFIPQETLSLFVLLVGMHGRGKQWGCLELVCILSPLYQTWVFHRGLKY